MATCPKCFGALTEHHRCPKGRLSRVTDALGTLSIGGGTRVVLLSTIAGRPSRVTAALGTLSIGGVIGIVLIYMIDERPVPALLVAAAALGAVLANAVRQAVSGRP